MKKFKVLFLILALIAIASPAHALMCKDSQSGNSDECWTQVKVSSGETTTVDVGTVLVYDFTSNGGDTDVAAFQVRVSSASTDSQKVAGVAQRTIATGDSGMVLVRGKGKIKTAVATTSGDRLFTSIHNGKSGINGPTGNNASHDKAIAFALQTSTTEATIDAYITVI